MSTAVTEVLIDERYDQTVRWQPGERLHQLAEGWARTRGDAVAVDTGAERITFGDLDARADRLARHLHRIGVNPGDRVALLLDEAVRTYVAMLAVGKLHAAFVPLDAAFPTDRIAYILRDAEVRTAVTVTALADRLGDDRTHPVLRVCVDAESDAIDRGSPRRLLGNQVEGPVDELAYLIYTSGTTGRPKGVAVEHASIVNFVRVAAEVYGYRPDDRVYQGMTVAFDFSVEELWVPWATGATVVPRPAGRALVGEDLQRFLVAHRITALACVPALLTTLDEAALAGLRFLLVSGEACPRDLVVRWHREGRRFLNVYGPTEACVSATWTTVHPDRPVTLGRPLPTYAVVVIDPDDPVARPVAAGELGEIAIAGVGLARGYLGLPERTDTAFVPDPLALPGNPSGRLYRTGDLGRATADGEIEFHGRIDLQVKVRGYRIELTEIESVMLGDPSVAGAVADTREPVTGAPELVGWFSLRPACGETADDVRPRLRSRLSERLPAYMVPTFLEHLPAIPLTASNKVDRAMLPSPVGPRAGGDGTVEAPATATETEIVVALATTLGADVESLSVTADLFADLGASSLLLARLATRVHETGRSVAIGEIYGHPSVRALAALLDERDAAPAHPGAGAASLMAPPVRAPHRASTLAVVASGVAQALLFLGYLWLFAVAVSSSYEHVAGGTGVGEVLLRALAAGGTGFAVLVLGPVAAKWVLIGRFVPTEIDVWSARYLRFWLVKTLLRANVMTLFAGTPLYTLYLRALGARVGARAVVLTRSMPICTDLLTIGTDTVVRKDVLMPGYTAEGGRLRTGAITLGDRVFVGETAVLDVDSSIGDDAQLAHASSLHAQHVPAGERWHGSPARPAGDGADFQRVGARRVPGWRRALFALLQLLQVLVLVLPLAVLTLEAAVGARLGAATTPSIGSAAFWINALVIGTTIFVGGLATGLLLAFTLPRLLHRLVVPGRTYALFGLRYSLQRAVSLLSNRPLFNSLFGDSSWIISYLRLLGWDLGRVAQTGSNFGTTQKQESPFLSLVGRGTMVSDGLSMANAEFSSTAFRLVETRIGADNFLGNRIVFPAGGRTGDNVLLATKVMVPLDGPVHHDTGLLGSPAFLIPRSVQRDISLPRPATPLESTWVLRAKNRHNAATMALLLFARWGQVVLVTVLGLAGALAYDTLGTLAVAVAGLGAVLGSALWLVACERAAGGFRRLVPRSCSIHHPDFWRHERLWKLLVPSLSTFDGTPVKPWLLRALGVRVGRRLYDEGAVIPEHGLLSLGDDVTLALGTTLQCHSLEDGSFKSDRTHIGDGATVATGAFVHYGVTVGAGAVVDPDSFLMKGTDVPPGSRWRGNPAAAVGPVPPRRSEVATTAERGSP